MKGLVVDNITLRQAMESDAWLMVLAAEPNRNIDVRMSYADLWAIRKWVDESFVHKKGKDGITYVEDK